MRELWLAMLAAVLAGPLAYAQTYTVLHDFEGPPYPPSGIITQGHDGSFYFTTERPHNFVDVFKITPSGVLIFLYEFSGSQGGAGGVNLGTDGRFYGTIPYESSNVNGAIFTLTADAFPTILHSFAGWDGSYAVAPPTQGIDGNFYGTTAYGGSSDGGTVYRITPSRTLTVLHKFVQADGHVWGAPLRQANNGDFYGAAYGAGTNDQQGTVFRIDPSGKFLVVYTFHGTDGAEPDGVIQANDGDLYGTTARGGPNNYGVVFKISHGAFTVLHNFAGGSDGIAPVGGLVQATDGNLYGTSEVVGGCGTVFRISPAGEFATLYTLPSDGSLGCSPLSTLVQHTNGKLYGTTWTGGTLNNGVFFSFDVGIGPFVSFLPAARQVGHTVEILGQGFTGTAAVSFNGTPATTFNVLTDTFMTATAPDGATSGFINVTTPGGTLTSNKKFQVKPQITGFSPTSGQAGTSVVIKGVSLSQTSKVIFNSVVATNFTVNSDTQVTVTVPSGAATTKIGLVTTGAPIYTGTVFTVTQ
jgi:uncharacterized repeat protein (TIGR03803 family)